MAERLVESFPVIDDSGSRDVVDVYATVVIHRSMSGVKQLDGSKRCELRSSRSHVNITKNGSLEEATTGRQLTRPD